MKVKKKFLQQEINDKINSLRFKLNEMYKIKGHTKEVVDISQELDKYIAIVQQELVKKINIH
ncbi:aspartyl-phosphate phosphatase Spo0E family protein [Maledivibacter halophilus]|uniref:Spo0E like sporulation regulatory protein n=1 Tax=Maledivibacter halophilus TaxID=36842 RepID=A0A1T5I9F4_9FIRM|nr:aspartyl-phosphate phosphatase Spo0E family protein [Maledivibacter halophilus]SKC35794.1 Spo0E like sporulation regulatory protein [Maledivibacter halophilus]